MSDETPIGAGFTEGELTVANFWVRNRVLLRKIGRGTLIGVNVLLWGYTAWSILDAYAISYPRESRIVEQIAQNQFLASKFQSNQPKGVQTGTVSVFAATDDRLDMIVDALNPNAEWWADFTYRFNVSGELTPQQTGFILPGQRLYLGAFGFKPKTHGARSGFLIVDNLHWHRVDPSEVAGDYTSWLARRNQFRAEDVTFISDAGPVPSAVTSGTSRTVTGARGFSRTSLIFENPSAYGFWKVRLYVVLKRANSPIAATSIDLEPVRAGERRPVDIDWFERLPSVTETEIVPVVNFLDRDAYLPSTQTGE